MNVAALRSIVRNLCLERTGDTGLVTDAEILELLNVSARLIFMRIINKWPEAFATRTAALNVNSANMSLAFSTISSLLVKVLDIRVGATAAAENTFKQIPPLNKVRGRYLHDPPPASLPGLPYRWYIEGASIFFSPFTFGNFDARVTYIVTPTDMAADNDLPWNSKLPEYHDAIAVMASMMALSKDGATATGLDKVFQYIDKVLEGQYGAPYNPSDDSKP